MDESRVRVFGQVQPSSAVVVIAGRRARVAHGEFARWMDVRRGRSRIRIVATAAGLQPARMDIAVVSSPSKRTVARVAPSPSQAPPAATAPTTSPSGGRYPQAVRATVLRSCAAAAGNVPAAAASCECYVSYLEAHVSERTIADWERAFLKSEATLPAWAREAALACRRT